MKNIFYILLKKYVKPSFSCDRQQNCFFSVGPSDLKKLWTSNPELGSEIPNPSGLIFVLLGDVGGENGGEIGWAELDPSGCEKSK